MRQDEEQARQQESENKWGDPIDVVRQHDLQGYLDRWEREQNQDKRKGPFDGAYFQLTGADVFWLAAQVRLRELHDAVPDLNLQGANLGSAHLEGANLSFAHLEGANLGDAHLEGANLDSAHLDGADLRYAWLNSQTILSYTILDNKTMLRDIHWSGVGAVNLSQINWERVRTLGDQHGDIHHDQQREYRYRSFRGLVTPSNDPPSRAEPYEKIVRAYRQLAAQLRAQGFSEAADGFAFRAQVFQRSVLLRRGRILGYLGSWILALLAGYGFKPWRTIIWYLVVIASFAFMFVQATHGWTPFGLHTPSQLAPLTWYEALILSVTSFHGRGFFQPFQSPGDPVAALAAIEAVVGLFIEISFIATFTQRFFGAK